MHKRNPGKMHNLPYVIIYLPVSCGLVEVL